MKPISATPSRPGVMKMRSPPRWAKRTRSNAMSKTLLLVTTAGLLLCAAFLSLAVAIGGDDIFHDARSFGEVKPLIDLATHKTWRWKGGDTLALDAPMNIRYRPNEPPGVLVTGPEELLKHVRVSDGRIASDTTVSHSSGKRLD